MHDPNRVRVPCPDCHAMHSVRRDLIGTADWNLCPACDAEECRRIREQLAARGIALEPAARI